MKDTVLDHAEALAKALEPFDRSVPYGMLGDEQDVTLTFKARDFRAARSALAAYRSQPAAEVVVKPMNDADPYTCPDCGRDKALTATDAANGLCPKWWAIRDKDAATDCERHASLATPALAGTEPAGEVVEKPRELWKIAARELSDEDLAADLKEAERKFDNRGEHGGSPGEFWHERMDEIESEQARRRKAAFFQSEA